MIYDLIIAGAGPAGITAAIYAARKKIKTLVITQNIGGQAALSGAIENYTGYQFITGTELAKKFQEHLKNFNISLKEGKEISSIEKINNTFRIKTKNEICVAKTIVIATGRKPKMLNVYGEKEFKNRGISYCATCDAPFFTKKDVAVVGGGNSALDAVLQIVNIARRIYLINITSGIIGDKIMLEKMKKSEKVIILNNAKIKEIKGKKFVEKILLLVKKKEKILSVQGVFVEIGSEPLLPEVKAEKKLKLNEQGEIIVNEKCETNISGLFAAGDVTNVPEKQIIVAAGQGCIASLSAFKYLSRKNF